MPIREGCVTLCWPNWAERGEVTGGSWKSNFPLENMLSPIVAKAARSETTSPADTQFSFNFKIRSKPVAVVALMNHNLTVDAKWRVTWWEEEAQETLAYDSGMVDVWPQLLSTTELEWENDNFWFGELQDDDKDRFTPLATCFHPDGGDVVFSVRVEIEDEGNPDGFVKIGRLFLADVWQPRFSAQYGIEYGYEIDTSFEVADNAQQTLYADAKIPKRTVSFNLATLDSEEGFRRILTMQRDQGVHKEVLYTEGAETTSENFQKTFVGRLQNPSPLTHPYYRTFSNSINLIEIL